MPYITPNDAGIRADSDSRSIMNAIRAALNGTGDTHVVRIPRLNERTGQELWVIDETILLPSEITILLDDCHLIMADHVMCNMFRNENMYTEISCTPEGEQHDIRIIGRGNAILDGGNHNGLTEATMLKSGMPHVRNNNLILLHNLRDYRLEGFRCVRMRYWAINQICCRRGYVGHIDFDVQTVVRNQDGVNLRIGCSDILIEHITGITGDDVVALTALPKCSDGDLKIEGRDVDIHDITIRDVRAHTRCSIVALRNCDGAQLYRVQIENIADLGGEWGPWDVVHLGENNYFVERPSRLGETREITVRGVHSRARGTVFLGGSLMDSHISDVHAEVGAMYAVSTYYYTNRTDAETGCLLRGGVTLRNVVLENLYYSAVPSYCFDPKVTNPDEPFHGCAIDMRAMREEIDTLENVVVRNVFTHGEDKLLIHPKYELKLQ